MPREPVSPADWTRMDDYLRSEPSPEEEVAFKRWLDADPERRRAFEELRGLHEWGRAEQHTLPSGARQRGWEVIRGRTILAGRASDRFQPSARADRPLLRPSRRRRHALPAALVVAVAIVAVGTWAIALQIAPGTHPAKTWTTGPGQNATVTLSDGSRVRLASATTLTRPDPTARRYVLIGVARFEVARDEARPFSVETAHGVARVYGTTFTVRARQGAGVTMVSVEEGRVAVRSPEASGEVILTAGQAASAQVGRAPVRLDAPLLPEAAPEASIVLRFDGAPLSEVARALSEAYGVRVEVPDPSLAARPVHADFTGLPLDDALGALEAAFGLRAETQDGRFVLIPASPTTYDD